MKCELIKEQLSAYLDKELNPEEKIQVERHIGECPACKKELEELSLTVQAISSLPRLSAPQDACCEIKAKIQHAHPVYQKPALHIRFFKPVAILTAAAAGLLIAFYALITPNVKTTQYDPQPETDISTIDAPAKPMAMKQDNATEEFRETKKSDERNRDGFVMDTINNNANGAYPENEDSLETNDELADADENDWGESPETVYSLTVSEQELPEVLLAFQNELDRMNVYQDYDQPEKAKELFEYQYQKDSKGNTLKEKEYSGGKNAKTAALSVTVELTAEQEQKLFAFAKAPSRAQEKSQNEEARGFGASTALKLEKKNDSAKNISEGELTENEKNAEGDLSSNAAVTGSAGGGLAQDAKKPQSSPITPPPSPAESAPSRQPMPPMVISPGASPAPKPATNAPTADTERQIGSDLTDKTKAEESRKELEKEAYGQKMDKAVRAKIPARKKIRIVFIIDKTK
ncbi:MAG: zf-HC2 domain-containing protein [Planctomycetes bacterium]|nr:zf-HC2 domain-containing protein [Planctomycetota bacterium]